jgi:DNA-3-methyladenine glycosylase II
MVFSITAINAFQHLSKLGSKKLSDFIAQTGPIEIPMRYGNDPLMGLCRIVIGQQLSGRAAQAIWARIETQYPTRNARLLAFQTPGIPLEGVSKNKIKTLQAIALLGELGLNQIKSLTLSERYARLTALKGIGPWSVAMWNLFVLGEPDCWSDGDLILKRVSSQLTAEIGMDREEWIELASPFRSYLALYLWAFNDQARLTDVTIR